MEPDSLLANAPLESELEICIEALFDSCPELHGFSVQGMGALPQEFRSPTYENALVVADVGVDPTLGAEFCNRMSDEIAGVLLQLVKLRPEAADLLRDRTFVRVLH
jgi:hypothetical protein